MSGKGNIPKERARVGEGKKKKVAVGMFMNSQYTDVLVVVVMVMVDDLDQKPKSVVVVDVEKKEIENGTFRNGADRRRNRVSYVSGWKRERTMQLLS